MKRGGFLPDLRHRADIPEMMDDPFCDEAKLVRTIAGFRLLNLLVTRYRSVLGRWILSDMLLQPERRYHVADLGAGGCDIAVWLLGKCRRLGLDVSVLAVEGDERVAAYARRVHGSVPGLRIVCADATDLSVIGHADYAIGNHFLHHLDDPALEQMLLTLAAMPLRRFVFNDIRRSYWAYYLHGVAAAAIFPRTFMASDGRRSIRRGFTVSGLQALMARIGISRRVRISTMAPARIIIVSRPATRYA